MSDQNSGSKLGQEYSRSRRLGAVQSLQGRPCPQIRPGQKRNSSYLQSYREWHHISLRSEGLPLDSDLPQRRQEIQNPKYPQN